MQEVQPRGCALWPWCHSGTPVLPPVGPLFPCIGSLLLTCGCVIALQRCEIVDKHMRDLATKHMEVRILSRGVARRWLLFPTVAWCLVVPQARFIKINAEKAPFLCERLRIWMLPTIVLVRGGKTDYSIVGFDDLGGSDDFSTETLEQFLIDKEILMEAFA